MKTAIREVPCVSRAATPVCVHATCPTRWLLPKHLSPAKGHPPARTERRGPRGMASAGSACGGVLALVVVLVACAQPSLASHTPAASIEGLTFELESGAKPACVACNDAQLNRCWSNLMASAAYPSDGQVSEAAVCELQPAMQAFWACLKACAGGGACSAEELASLGVWECAGDPIPCTLGGCPKCPVGFTAAEVMTWGCEEKSDVFADFGCAMDCGENVCGNCPPPLPAGDYEHDLAECHLQQ